MVAARQELSPMMNNQAPSFDKAIDWLQFIYTSYHMGDFVEPASMFLFQYMVVEGDKLFLAF